MLSQLAQKCCGARRQHTLTPVCWEKCHLYSGGLPADALPPQHAGFHVFGGEGRGCAGAGAGAGGCSEQEEFRVCPYLFCRFPLLGDKEPCHATAPCAVLDGPVGDRGAAEQLCLAGLRTCSDSFLPLLGMARARFLHSLSSLT